MSKFDKLKTLKSNDIGLFNLKNKTAYGKIVKIFSPNKCQIIFGLNNLIFKFNCKLNGTQTNTNSNINNLIDLVSNSTDINQNTQIVKLTCHNFDKEGYLLVDISDNQKLINKHLIDNSHLSKCDYTPDELFDFNSDK
tara:strand:- start:402 stop:815 length:414 start_codon:yes stop_codon:yes gene_type:complete